MLIGKGLRFFVLVYRPMPTREKVELEEQDQGEFNVFLKA